MHLLALSFLLTLLDITEASKGSSLDLALETVLEFNEAIDPDLLEKIKGIIKDIRTRFLVKPQGNVPDENKEPYKFVDFLKGVLIAANSFDDDKLVDFFDIIRSEINHLDVKDINYLKGYFIKNVANIKRDSSHIRKNLDNLLNNLRNKHGNRNDNFYLNFINSLYKRNSERKLVKILNRLNVFRRRSQTGDDLRMFIKEALRDIVSDLNITDEKKQILNIWFDSYKRKLAQARTLTDIDSYDDAQSKLIHYNPKRQDKTFINKKEHIVNEKIRKPKENRVKLTHVTLYPDNLDIIDTRYFKPDANDAMQYENNENVREDNIKSDSERISSADEDSSGSNDRSDAKAHNYVATNDIEKTTKYIRTTQRLRKSKTFRHKTKKTENVRNIHNSPKTLESTEKRTTISSSASFEQFGNLDIFKKNTSKIRAFEKKFKMFKNNTISPFKNILIERDRNRRVHFPEKTVIQIKKSTLQPTKTIPLNTILNDNFKNNSESYSTTIFITSNTSDATVHNENLPNVTTKMNKPLKMIENKTEAAATTTTTHFSTETTNLTSFDINHFIKNSEIQDIENIEKKKVIEEKLMEDLNSLFSSPTTTTTTEAYEDIFKGMEDEFNLS